MKELIKKIIRRKLVSKDFKDANKINANNIDTFLLDENYWLHKRNLKVTSNKSGIIFHSKSKKIHYASFLESNFKFSLPPEINNDLPTEGVAKLQLTGSTSSNLKVTFYIIEFHNEERVFTRRLKLNQTQKITFRPETTSIRMALRIEGKGEVHLNNFSFEVKNNISLELNTDVNRTLKDIKVACILDEFSTLSFSDVFQLIQITPENWRIMLEKQKPDFLLVESAWKGIEGKWQYQIGKYNNNYNNFLLKQVIEWFNEHNIPTVFWNKEDPIHFNKFIETAKLFDYIFTTDENMVAKYKLKSENEKVFSLPFAANPKIHNPIYHVKPRKRAISFAGSYYANRHEERKLDMEYMLDIAKKYSLDIFDRNYKDGEPINENFQYPKRFENNIRGSLPYSQIDKAYKNYRLMLNVNSVKYSPTMFSRRVFEGLASGTPIVSSYSKGIKKFFADTIIMGNKDEEIIDKIEKVLDNEKYYRKKSLQGIRSVYSKHKYTDRAKYILNKINIPFNHSIDGITVIMRVESLNDYYKAIKLFNNQHLKEKKAVIIIDIFEGFEELLNNFNSNNIQTIISDYINKYPSKEFIYSEYFTVMDINLNYGKHYLEDLYYGTLYSGAEIVGKKIINMTTYDIEKFEYEYVDYIIPETAAFKVGITASIDLEDIINNPENIINYLFRYKGAKLFSVDKFNFSWDKSKLIEV